jgi:hypothetical protein
LQFSSTNTGLAEHLQNSLADHFATLCVKIKVLEHQLGVSTETIDKLSTENKELSAKLANVELVSDLSVCDCFRSFDCFVVFQAVNRPNISARILQNRTRSAESERGEDRSQIRSQDRDRHKKC